MSGGYIWAESAVVEGSTFTIYLPWHAPLPAAEAGRRAEARAATGAGETVLVVDDEPAVRLVTKRILQRNGYTVLEASGGHEALRVLREHPGPIQLLLSDVIMPEMNGREVASGCASGGRASKCCSCRPTVRRPSRTTACWKKAPRFSASRSRSASCSRPCAARSMRRGWLDRVRVLIVEDDPELAGVLRSGRCAQHNGAV